MSAIWRLPKTDMGGFTLSMDGTWLHSYKYQNEKNGAFDENVGKFGATYVKFRWQHTLSLGWKNGPFCSYAEQLVQNRLPRSRRCS
ncbi:hypothetical protein LP419_09830 [Massilia sp. H-1]|nr:hypothetical protein LP419_09830 [Massilia sp. H-1]